MNKIVNVAVVLGFFFCAGFAVVSYAQLSGEHIEQYRSLINIRDDGKVEITEKILYDFTDLQRHGIFRTFPITKTNKDGKKFSLDYADITVQDDTGVPYHFSESTDTDTLTLKIGDANRTITGKHEYDIHYVVSGAITYFSDHDELYWNVVGTEWTVPISSAQTDVVLASKIPPSGATARCFTGAQGSTSSSCGIDVTGSTIRVSTIQTLQPSEGLTVVVGFKQGVIAHLEPREVIAFTDTWYGKLILALAVILGGMVVLLWYVVYPIKLAIAWYTKGRDPHTDGPVKAWFDPPQTTKGRKLTPAETGALIDERADLQDILAMVVDLARRRHYRIVEKEKGSFYLIKEGKAPAGDTLMPFEQHFMSALFSGGDEVKIKGTSLISEVDTAKKDIYEQLTADKFFPENPATIRTKYTVIAVLAAITANPLLILSALVFGMNMPIKTLFGAQQCDIAKSLKNFLSSQERQLEYQAKNQMFFEKLLPYAVAFGVEKVWAERFSTLDLRQPDWYQGYGTAPFNSTVFVHSMRSSFAQITTAATPTTSSSGFSSGFSGGSSGGGGGGGGGGSW